MTKFYHERQHTLKFLCLCRARARPEQESDLLQIQEGYSRPGSKLYICDLPGIRTPIHIARNYITIAENTFYNGDMSSPGSSLHSRLQIYDGSHYWRA